MVDSMVEHYSIDNVFLFFKVSNNYVLLSSLTDNLTQIQSIFGSRADERGNIDQISDILLDDVFC